MNFSEREKKLSNWEHLEERAEWHISRFESPAKNLLSLLRKNIDQKKYDSILGDDASGRIHALLLGGAIKEIYGEEKNIEIAFVKGGHLYRFSKEHEEAVKTYLERLNKAQKLGSKTLIVTEEIMTGETVEKLALTLRLLGIEADIATFGLAEPDEFGEDNPYITSHGIDIYIGGRSTGPPIPQEYLGVWGEEISDEGYAVKRPQNELHSQQIKAVREAVNDLAHKLAQEYIVEDAQELNAGRRPKPSP